METTIRCYQVDRREISFIKFILEAYDNLAVLSTVDPAHGLVHIRITPGCETFVDDLVTGLLETVPSVDGDVSSGTND